MAHNGEPEVMAYTESLTCDDTDFFNLLQVYSKLCLMFVIYSLSYLILINSLLYIVDIPNHKCGGRVPLP